jgi:hypothetical protein
VKKKKIVPVLDPIVDDLCALLARIYASDAESKNAAKSKDTPASGTDVSDEPPTSNPTPS